MRSTDRQRRIEQRAHEIWEAEGRPHGKHDEHWQRAEREIAAQEGGGRGGKRTSGSGGKGTGTKKAGGTRAQAKTDASAKKAGGATKRTAKPAASAAAASSTAGGTGRGRRKQPSAG